MSKKLFFLLAFLGLVVLAIAHEDHDHSHEGHGDKEHDHSHEGHDSKEHDHSLEGHDHGDHSKVPLCADGCPTGCECMGDKFCGNSSVAGGMHDKHLACKMPEEYMMPEESNEPDEPACFPADALVTLPTGVKSISQLEIGDRVLVRNGKFSEVVMFTHRDAAHSGKYIELITETNTIQLTRGHYIYANGDLVPSETVKTGDVLTLADGSSAAVTAVHEAKNVGLYNPQTAHGDIVVGGIVASTYTTFVEPSAAHTLLAPIRALFQAGGSPVLDSFSGLFGAVSN